MQITVYPDNILRELSKKIAKVTDEERNILNEMVSMMHTHNGVGLAAPQVGISKRLIVVDIGKGPIKLANPVIIEKKGECFMDEGCLSVPEQVIYVPRAKDVKVVALDENNKKIQIIASGLLARVLQHEIDHLDGKLIIDYLT